MTKTKNTTKSDQSVEEYPNSISKGKKFSYQFWKNKPVSSFDEMSLGSQKIEDDLSKRRVYGEKTPIKLPDSMKWVTIDLEDSVMMDTVVSFLRMYYLIDVKKKFKLDYTADFIKWALGNDGIMIAIVTKDNNTICGIIGTSFKTMTIFNKIEKFAVVDFLCSHPFYRKKKIAFTLIDEIVRRIVSNGVHQGCFTTERCVPSPTTVIRYYHRPINYIKLQKYGFTDVGGKPDKVQEKFTIKGVLPSNCVPMTPDHIQHITKLHKKFMSRFNIYCNYSEDDMKHLLLNNNYVKSYVITENEQIVDFLSYYLLPYFMDNENDKINAAYLFLYSCNNISNDTMIENILKICNNNGIDILNVTDTGTMSDALLTKDIGNDDDSDIESYEHVYEHKFLKGSGKLHFNFFNWKCPTVKPKQISWVTF